MRIIYSLYNNNFLILFKLISGEIVVGLKKQNLKSKPVCKVTFIMPKEAVESAKKVHVVGDFNNWEKKSLPLKKLKKGI